MSLVQGWFPPSRENWEFIAYAWQFFPLLTAAQWLTDFYPQGKTSIDSRLNLPGKWAWAIMESVGPLTVLYCIFFLPSTQPELHHLQNTPLPWGNWTMAGIYTIHYVYRALICPLTAPSMSPIHPLVFISACAWNLMNGLSIGGWVGGYGPQTSGDWAGRLYSMEIGLVIWGWGLLGNMFHDDDLREIRRSVIRMRKEKAAKEGKTEAQMEGVDKLYMLPKNGLFHYVLHAHYLCEWIEWTGFWILAGLGCVPARSFLFNEIATMLPRALAGKRWYEEKFGKEKVAGRKAVIPGLL
ncbi:hypothetical protein Q7P36_010690 [Cladosporium allicinum]